MSFQFRKFYDVNAPEQVSIAAAMASSGTVRQSGYSEPAASVTNPSETNSQTQQASKPEEATPVNTSVQDETSKPASAENAKPETTALAIETKPIPAVVERSWQEVLKSQQPDTVLKELGFDDQVLKLAQKFKGVDSKVLGIIDHWQNKGNVKDYFEALSIDYSKMSPEDVMRRQLRIDYPPEEMSPEDFEVLYNDRVTDKYKLDPEMYSEDEIRKGKILLAADSKKTREGLIRSQEDYLLPKAPDASAVSTEQDYFEQQAAQATEAYKAEITNDSYTKDILNNKRIVIGEGEEAFKYDMPDPLAVQNILIDNKAWANAVFKSVQQPDGTVNIVPNTQKQWLLGAVAYDDDFLNKYAAHYKSIGAKTVNDLLDNAKKLDGTPATAEVATDNPAKAMAKKGRVITA